MMIEIILILLFSVLLINYIYFLSNINNGLKRFQFDIRAKISDEFISVIIPFRNESENILTSLKSISSLDYPLERFEVIYVNDSSTDDSYEKIINAAKPINFKVISLPVFSHDKAFKKKAVSYGIENSQGEIIITTDADCIHNQNWLRELISGFDFATGFVSGPVSFNERQNLFSKIQSLEFAGLILSGAGLIGIGKPAICNGANLAFRKSVYKELHGYHDQMHLSSGEDELLMQKIAAETDYSVKFCWNKGAVVFTQPNENLRDFLQQRQRWASKGLFYKNKLFVISLALIYLFYLGFPAQILLSIFASKIFLISFGLSLISKLIMDYIIIKKGVNFLFKDHMMKYFLQTEIFQIIYITLAGFLGTIGNYKWKDRNLKR
jgi:cellulose synthase/poly-beta-1,6-N-acetylglucosamine synthase-like glycosyltransferase